MQPPMGARKKEDFTMKKVALLLCLVLLASMTLPGLAEDAAFQGIGVVHTQYGDVSGVLGATENVTVFKGVPYAAALG